MLQSNLDGFLKQNKKKLIDRALTDDKRGYGNRKIKISNEASDHLVDVSNGDARCLLNALELAVESTPEDDEALKAAQLAEYEYWAKHRRIDEDSEPLEDLIS